MANSPDYIELFTKTEIVAGMSPEQVRVLADCGKEEAFASGSVLVTREDEEFDLLIVLEGKVEICTTMDDMLYRLGPGSLIGEVSFLDHKPRSAKAVACLDSRTIRFPASLLEDLEDTRPDIVAKLLRNIGGVLCQKLRSTTRFAEASFV